MDDRLIEDIADEVDNLIADNLDPDLAPEDIILGLGYLACLKASTLADPEGVLGGLQQLINDTIDNRL